MSGAVPESLGHYRIVSLIGEGGMGEVYLADDQRLGRRVAIKILPESVSRVPEAKKRMLREARTVAKLDHPNVCTIYEIGEHEGRPFIVMQYIEGETLYERLQRAHPHLGECVDIATQVAAALDEAHSHGVVHRDIKTLNIMLTPRGQVKVLDFGLAKVETSEMSTDMMMSKPGSVTGTAPYMSPEQLRGLPIDGRSDIFSLGVVLYEMAAGQRPFDRENAVSTITAILFEEPPPIEDDEYSPLAPIIRRALAKEPSKRYPTAAVMLEALQNTQKARTRPITAKIPSTRTPKPRGRIDSLAVLARTSATPEPEHEYLVYGLGESIISTLSQMRKLRVIAASTVARQAGAELDAQSAGRELNVNAIVVLNARVEQERLYVDVELVATADGAKLWSSQYMRPIREVAALAETIAGDVGEQVRARGAISSGPPRTTKKKKRAVDPEALQLFLKGRFQWIKRHPEALKLAMSYFQQAVEHDPSFALPYAGLADAFLMLGFMQALPPREILPKAKAAAQRAIELDATLADPHATLGYAAGLFEWDWETAQRELDTAMRLNANYPWAPHWLGLLASGRGQTRHGLELIERAQTLDPLSPIINIAAGIPLHIARRYDEAVTRFRSVLETETSFAPGHYYIALALEQRGDHDEAIGHLRRVVEIAGTASIYLGALAHACARAGRTAEAEAIIEQLREANKQRYVTPFAFFVAYAGLDRIDEALAALPYALEERNAWMWFVPVDPRFDRLRGDARFAPLMARYGLPPFLETDVS